MDPLAAQIRQVFFFDTPDLTLNAAGVVVRARRVQGKGDDTVIKLRPVEPEDFPAEVQRTQRSASRWTRCRAGSSALAPSSGRPRRATSRMTIAGQRRCASCSRSDQRAF